MKGEQGRMAIRSRAELVSGIWACHHWFRMRFGLQELPLPSGCIISGDLEGYQGVYCLVPRFWEDLRRSFPLGLLASVALVYWLTEGGDSAEPTDLFLIGVFVYPFVSLFLCFPVLLLFHYRPTIAIDPGASDVRSILAHELAHAYHNAHRARLFIHVWVDYLLLPFCLSYQEGIALWVEKEYHCSQGLPFDVDGYRCRDRWSYRAIYRIEKLCGRRAAEALFLYL
jgi:hypothetical protein